MYARLRGIPEVEIKRVVDFLIDMLDFREHANKQAALYRLVADQSAHALCVSGLDGAVAKSSAYRLGGSEFACRYCLQYGVSFPFFC